MRKRASALWKFFENELKSILEPRYIASVFITLAITLFLSFAMVSLANSFKEGELSTSLPLVNKLATVGIYNTTPHLAIEIIEDSTSIYTKHVRDIESGLELIKKKQIHALLIVEHNSSKLILGDSEINTFIEQLIRTALDKVYRKETPSFELRDDLGLNDLIKGIIAPIMLFSPLFLFSVPIIQSIAYDRENKILEVLFALNISKTDIFLGKVLATMAFTAIMSFIWLTVVYFSGYQFKNFFGVYIVFLAVALMITAMNAMVSTVSSSVQEASLSASILSTIIFVLLFGAMLFKLVKPLEIISQLTPTTYISSTLSEENPKFPYVPFFLIIASTLIFILMGSAAFSTEQFAFSQKPGLNELFFGTVKMIENKPLKYFTATFFSYILTLPVQIVILLTIFFLVTRFEIYNVSPIIALMIVGFSFAEELLKSYSVRALNNVEPKRGTQQGIIVGFIFGLLEMAMFLYIINLSGITTNIWLLRIIQGRIGALILHTVATGFYGYSLEKNGHLVALGGASTIHSFYNLYLFVKTGAF